MLTETNELGWPVLAHLIFPDSVIQNRDILPSRRQVFFSFLRQQPSCCPSGGEFFTEIFQREQDKTWFWSERRQNP
jgi:hypothetical protein